MSTRRKDAAYAQTESYLLEITLKGWKHVRAVMLQSGPGPQGKTDVLHIERLM